jgi:hypothetical protein
MYKTKPILCNNSGFDNGIKQNLWNW